MSTPHERAPWRQGLVEGDDSLFAGLPHPDDRAEYATLTYEVTGRIARITFNRPANGNAITPDTPLDLAHAVERADLDPRVHVVVVAGTGSGFCGGYDLGLFAESDMAGAAATGEHAEPRAGTVLDPVAQARNHDPARVWDPTVDYAMMSRFNRGFASLLHADKPTVAKLHGYCVGGGTDIALFADQIIAASDTKIGYPPTRVWGTRRPACGPTDSATSGRSDCCSPATR
ncbi:MAG TPA: crotonase/enoyl-CoA hydratase family protein [Jatrophihabitans sp.]|nr:crotonase/enoyl-CoA hydratase family protein [Jatrophihabitans sp.]